MEVEVIQLIKTQLLRRGAGEDASDPIRIITQYWDMEGNQVFEIDPHLDREVLDSIDK